MEIAMEDNSWQKCSMDIEKLIYLIKKFVVVIFYLLSSWKEEDSMEKGSVIVQLPSTKDGQIISVLRPIALLEFWPATQEQW